MSSSIMMENLLPQIGTPPKQMAERYADYPAVHDQHFYYTYEPAPHSHGHTSTSKHHHNGGGHKSNAAMSALTLLAFLFFLHILQQCLKDHMNAMSTPQVMIMSAGKEGDENIATISRIKTDKSGTTDLMDGEYAKLDANKKNDALDEHEQYLMKITTSEREPQNNAQKFKNIYKSNDFKNSYSTIIGTIDKK